MSVSKEQAEASKLLAEANLKQFELDTKKGSAESDLLFQKEKKSLILEKLRAEAKKASFEANLQEISYRAHKREEEKVLTSDRYNRVYRFVNPIEETSVAECMFHLSKWSRLDPKCEMEIIFCSPGGSIIDGFALFDFIQDLKRKGHKITTKALGYAASMAGVLLQAGNERVMGKESWMLVHKGSFTAMGKVDEVTDTVAWVKKMAERVADIYATRAETKTGKSKKSILAFIKKNWDRKDWWISSDEALEFGFCDRVE